MAERALLFDSGTVHGQGASYPEQCINIYKTECHNYNTENGRIPTLITYVVVDGIVWGIFDIVLKFYFDKNKPKEREEKKKTLLR